MKTALAVDFVGKHGGVLVTSVGMNTWELSLALASDRNVPAIIVIPSSKDDCRAVADRILERFRLNPYATGFAFLSAGAGRSKKIGWPDRDEAIVRMADNLLPVSIRRQGVLERLLRAFFGKVNGAFEIPYQSAGRPRPRYTCGQVNPLIQKCDLLIHFTRSTSSPWPDETEYDFYMAVVHSGDSYCRSAACTLKHILSTGIIYGSGRHIRRREPAVAFTRLDPSTAARLFRYRARIVNPYFEPFGIGITRHVGQSISIRPVRYGPSDLYKALPDDEKPYFQNVGADGTRWRGENEWRCRGDFDLRRVPERAVFAIVPTPSYVESFGSETRFRVLPLFSDGSEKK